MSTNPNMTTTPVRSLWSRRIDENYEEKTPLLLRPFNNELSTRNPQLQWQEFKYWRLRSPKHHFPKKDVLQLQKFSMGDANGAGQAGTSGRSRPVHARAADGCEAESRSLSSAFLDADTLRPMSIDSEPTGPSEYFRSSYAESRNPNS